MIVVGNNINEEIKNEETCATGLWNTNNSLTMNQLEICDGGLFMNMNTVDRTLSLLILLICG